MLKAVSYAEGNTGETFIIEEVQLFQASEAIKILRLSDTTVLHIHIHVHVHVLWCATFLNSSNKLDGWPLAIGVDILLLCVKEQKKSHIPEKPYLKDDYQMFVMGNI